MKDLCDRCGKDLSQGDPFEEVNNKEYCGDCAFVLGYINDKQYLKNYLYFIDIPGIRAVVHNDQVYIGTAKFEWERSSRKRDSKAYTNWRKEVFERDNFTCQMCGKHGGTLNAHRIKPYVKYKDLRTEVKNGITLCLQCHRQVHKKRGEDLSQNAECSQKQ